MAKIIKVNSNGKLIDIDINKLQIKDKLSYSRIDCFKSCEYKYKLKYIDKNYTNDSSIALQIGTILHLGLEYKYLKKYSDNKILSMVFDGTEEDGKKIVGINELKNELYPFEWEELDKNGITYDEKMDVYKERLNSKIDTEWECLGCEVEFSILFEEKCVIGGFIDRVDRNKSTGQLRVVDYKSSASEYQKKDLATPMQMYIYALACKEIYGQFPSEFIYDMILIGSKQYAMTKGWEKRGLKALNSRIDSLIWHSSEDNIKMKPKPTPLCHWCSYCKTNLNATNGRDLCEYYSLWTRDEKTFKTNKQWVEPVVEDYGWGDEWE
ncbi:MAG: PD-(D/E)XK nuclease family protein [Clostridium sp.]